MVNDIHKGYSDILELGSQIYSDDHREIIAASSGLISEIDIASKCIYAVIGALDELSRIYARNSITIQSHIQIDSKPSKRKSLYGIYHIKQLSTALSALNLAIILRHIKAHLQEQLLLRISFHFSATSFISNSRRISSWLSMKSKTSLKKLRRRLMS